MDFDIQRKSGKVIAVDFDGTIVEHKYPDIGMECPSALMYLRQWKAEGIKLILWTMRSGTCLDKGAYLRKLCFPDHIGERGRAYQNLNSSTSSFTVLGFYKLLSDNRT